MTFLSDAIFPTNISYGSKGGPRFNTMVIRKPSGAESRIARWTTPLREYDARYGLKDHSDMYDLMEHFVVAQGSTHTWPYKDFADYATTATGTTHNPGDASVTATDVQIGTGDNSETQFQIIKKYTYGSTSRNRNILLPKDGTLLVAVASVTKTEGTDYTVDYTTGIITFIAAPTSGQVITIGTEFYVVCRYHESIDVDFQPSIDEFDAESLPSIPIVEVRDETPLVDGYPFGGFKDNGDIGAISVAISPVTGLVQLFEASGGNGTVQLPATTDIQDGGPHFILIHDGGGSSILVKNNALSATLTTMSGGQERWIYYDDTNDEWFAVG